VEQKRRCQPGVCFRQSKDLSTHSDTLLVHGAKSEVVFRTQVMRRIVKTKKSRECFDFERSLGRLDAYASWFISMAVHSSIQLLYIAPYEVRYQLTSSPKIDRLELPCL
jgi:hypothetical protein